MSTSPLGFNHWRQQEKQMRRGDSKSSKSGSNSEVILILGEPTQGDLSAILRMGATPTRSGQRRLLMFASHIHDLPLSALQTQFLDIHILPKRLGEISGSNSHCSDETPGEAINLLGVLERASQFAVTWRADADRFIQDGQLTNGGPQLSSRHDSARLSDRTHAIGSPRTNHSNRTTPATLKNVNDDTHTKLRNPRDHRNAQSNSSSKFTASRRTVLSSKGLFSNFLSFSLPSVPRPSSPSISHPQSATHSGFRSHNRRNLLEIYARTFDTILNFLPPDQTEKSLLKQVILLSTLCGQYIARSKPETLSLSYGQTFESPNSRANSPRRSSSGAVHSQNLKDRATSLFSRNSPTESRAGEARRTSTASSDSSASESASSARSSTPSETSRSTTLSDTPKRRSSMLSWLSTTSASQASDPETGADTKVDIRTNFDTDASHEKSIELRRRLTFQFGRIKRSESPEGVTVTAGGENDLKRRRTKFVQQISPKHAYIIHVLPTSLSPEPAGRSSDALHNLKTKNKILDESELLEKRRGSLPSPSALPGALNGSTETAFTHARMQSSLMRRATLQQIRLYNSERRYSVPAASVERKASRSVLNTSSRGISLTRKAQVQKMETPALVDQLESFIEDYFGQGKREILPFVLDGGVFGREVDIKMGKSGSKKVLVGEAVLFGLLDEFAMNRQCWIGDEDVSRLAEYLKAGDDEETEESAEEEIAKSPSTVPKHPPPAAISPSSSEGSEGAGPANIPTSQRSRSRALSDTVVTSKHDVIPLPRASMSALKAPEPAHIYPPSRSAAISQSLRAPTRDIALIPAAKKKTVSWFEAKLDE